MIAALQHLGSICKVSIMSHKCARWLLGAERHSKAVHLAPQECPSIWRMASTSCFKVALLFISLEIFSQP